MMESVVVRRHKLLNAVHSLLILTGMAGVFALLGWLLGGFELMVWACAVSLVMFLFAPQLSPPVLLSFYGARPLHPREAPSLYEAIEVLSQRAGLRFVPDLYYIPTRVLNALSVGKGRQAAVGLTDGILRHLTMRELVAVIAHELSHIKNNDVWIMGLADFVTRMTHMLSLVGQIMVLVSLPLIVFTDLSISWAALLLMIFAPLISSLMQFALSRTREFDADLDAVRLTGDPEGLANALTKLEYHSMSMWERLFLPTRRNPDPSVLRSHPSTQERVKRLLSLTPTHHHGRREWSAFELPSHVPEVRRYPRHRRFFGLWH